MSPDPYSGSIDMSNPQSFNRYSYVLNSPLRYTDPLGLRICDGSPADTDGCTVGGDGGFIGVFSNFFDAISSLFGGHPSFHGSRTPRPNGNIKATVTSGPTVTNPDGTYTITDYYRVPQYVPSASFDGFAPPFLTIGPSNTPTPHVIHGNWCGPDWTGGRAGPYSLAIDSAGGYLAPVDGLDGNCMQHDKCYAGCRASHTCDAASRGSCFARCDRTLATQTNSDLSIPGASINIVMTIRGSEIYQHGAEPNPMSCSIH